MKTQGGLSLAETVVASFLLLAGFVMIARLFDASLRFQHWSDSVAKATEIGEDALEQVLAWAEKPANFDQLEAIYSPLSYSRAGYQIEIKASPARTMASPCNELEESYPPNNRRLMKGSFKPLEVKVEWTRDQLRLATLVGDPPRQIRAANPLVIQMSGAGTLAKDASVNVTAAVYDVGNREIPDVFFYWMAKPISGRGSLVNVQRDGSSAQFKHTMLLPNGAWGHSPGTSPPPPAPALPLQPSQCKVGVGASYLGRELTIDSPPVDLDL